MAQSAPPQPADAISMELDEPTIDAATIPSAAADAAAAAADLLQISAAAGQLRGMHGDLRTTAYC